MQKDEIVENGLYNVLLSMRKCVFSISLYHSISSIDDEVLLVDLCTVTMIHTESLTLLTT